MPYNVPTDRKYNADHYWVKIDGGVAIIGRTDYWTQNHNTVTAVDITFTSGTLVQGAKFGRISDGSFSDLILPLSGKYNDENDNLDASPGLVTSDPYNQGWILKITNYDGDEYDDLLAPEQYRDIIE